MNPYPFLSMLILCGLIGPEVQAFELGLAADQQQAVGERYGRPDHLVLLICGKDFGGGSRVGGRMIKRSRGVAASRDAMVG